MGRLKDVVLEVLKSSKHYSNKLKRVSMELDRTIETRMSLNAAQLQTMVVDHLSNVLNVDIGDSVDPSSFIFMAGDKHITEMDVQYRLKT